MTRTIQPKPEMPGPAALRTQGDAGTRLGPPRYWATLRAGR